MGYTFEVTKGEGSREEVRHVVGDTTGFTGVAEMVQPKSRVPDNRDGTTPSHRLKARTTVYRAEPAIPI